MYVSRCPFAAAYQCEGGLHSRGGPGGNASLGASFLPNETWSQWNSVGKGSSDSLSVPRNDQGPATYLVAVQGQSYFSAYTLAYSFEDTVLALQAGVLVSALSSINIAHPFLFSFPDLTPLPLPVPPLPSCSGPGQRAPGPHRLLLLRHAAAARRRAQGARCS